MPIGETAPPHNPDSIKWLTAQCKADGMLFLKDIQLGWHDAIEAVRPLLKGLDVPRAQRRLVKLISHQYPHDALPVAAKLIDDLHDENRGDIERPYDMDVLQNLGLLESVYGTVNLAANEGNFLDLAARFDLNSLSKRRMYLQWLDDYQGVFYSDPEIEGIVKHQKALRRFRKSIQFGASRAS